MNANADRPELARLTLSVLAIGTLLVGSVWVLAPFIASLIWAAMITIATWPMLLQLERAFGGRRAPAVASMTLVLLAIFIVPLGLAIDTVLQAVDEFPRLAATLRGFEIPMAPLWITQLSFIGERLAHAWNEVAAAGVEGLITRGEPYARAAVGWSAHQASGIAMLVVQLLLIVVLSAVLYSGGESWARWMRNFGRRLAGPRGDRIVVLASQAIRGVALGVVVTALVQTLLSGLGLVIVGVPFAGVLTAIILVFCIAQLGPTLVLLGATAWAFWALGAGWGTFMLVWSIIVGLLDNFLRPVLIRRGADLPMLLIIAGVIGGLVAFGVIGIFVGPVVLAVTYTLLDEWVSEQHAPDADNAGAVPLAPPVASALPPRQAETVN